MTNAFKRNANVLLLLTGVLAGVFGTTFVLGRGRPVPSVSTHTGGTVVKEDHGKEDHGKEGDEHGDEHGDEDSHIKLSPEAEKTAGIRVMQVGYTSGGESLSVPGTVEVTPNLGARITPPAPGKVVRILANLGDTVKAGQPLLVLDSYEVAQAHAQEQQAESGVNQARAALQTAQAEIGQAEAGVRIAQAELAQARTRVKSAESALERQQELAKAGAFSQPSLQAAQSEVSTAESEMLQAQTDLQTHLVSLQRAERLFREELISRQELEQAQLEHRQDQSRVAQARSRVDNAKRTLEREQRVFQGDLLNRREVQTAEAEVRAAQGVVQTALQSVARAQQDVRRAQRGEQAARTSLRGAQGALNAVRTTLAALEGSGHAEGTGGLVTLSAPIGGVVAERNATVGQAVERATTLLVVENLHTVQVIAQVPEKDVARVRVGMPVAVSVNAYPGRRFSGLVQSLAGRVDMKTRALPVRCLVENRGGLLRSEMFANVSLAVGARTRAITVAASAVDHAEDGAAVYVREDEGYERRPVRVARELGDVVEIVSGLKAGEKVVVEGVFVLKSEGKKESLKGHDH